MAAYFLIAVGGANFGFLLSAFLTSGKMSKLYARLDCAEAALASQSHVLRQLVQTLTLIVAELQLLPAGTISRDTFRQIEDVLALT